MQPQLPASKMKISVLIPTYRRATSLHRCLEGLQCQVRTADEVLVVTQDNDAESDRMLQKWVTWPSLKVIRGTATGQVNQLNVGLTECTGDVIAITDDDAIPRADWLEHIEQHFLLNPDLGGVGGRDFVQEDGHLLTGDRRVVGKAQWFGRIIGNHHLGTQLCRNVDVLKGANMAYRRTAIGDLLFDTRLRGRGAQTCNDMAFSMAIRKKGWRLLFDPEVAVDHFPDVRFDGDQRAKPTLEACEDTSFNFYWTLRHHMRSGAHRRAALLWAVWVGTKNTPGIFRGVLARLSQDREGQALRAAAARAWKQAAASRLAN